MGFTMWLAILIGLLISTVAGAVTYLWGYTAGRMEGRAMWKEVFEELRDFG
jgi:membrane protein DedA with SNARE-associated domain